MQIVYLSNRPNQLAETLIYVQKLMPFIECATVCYPDQLKSKFQAIESTMETRLVAESEILAKREIANLGTLDHQRRNYLLRKRLISTAIDDPVFIMSDDDARPLKPINQSDFIEHEKYRSYYFYDLRHWQHNLTAFDAGQIATRAILDQAGLSQRAFASHMPQIIDREMYLQAADYFQELAEHYPICEWASYFNHAQALNPQRFHIPQPYATLCWPEHPLAWKKFVEPEQFLFENYTPSLYVNGAVFADLPVQHAESIDKGYVAIEKILRWQRYNIQLNHPEQGRGLSKFLNPRTWVNKLFR